MMWRPPYYPGLALALMVPGQVLAQDTLEYAVKFVCGEPTGARTVKTSSLLAAPGTYFTSINVHNPNRDRLAFVVKFAVAAPGGRDSGSVPQMGQPGRVTQFSTLILSPDEALNVDCFKILSATKVAGFVEGFAVFQSGLPLDVACLYTATGAGGLVATEHVAPIPARTIGGK